MKGKNKENVIAEASKIIEFWDAYENKDLMIIANDEDGAHNAITPICRYKNNKFELDIVLRNNLTTEDRPLGLYHPRKEYWNIKKENIGLVEALGLAVLPSRLKEEIELVKKYIIDEKLTKEELEKIEIHMYFANQIKNNLTNTNNVDDLVRQAIIDIFVKILEDCAVFKESSIDILKDVIKNL